MKNFEGCERSKGVMCLVREGAQHDYVRMAETSLALAGHFLGVPTVMQHVSEDAHWRNFRIDVDTRETLPWNNHGRWQAYAASPWDETIVIDADYVITTDALSCLWGSRSDYLLCHHNSMLKQQAHMQSPLLVWATVFWFRKSDTSSRFFEMVSRIERSYQHHVQVFGIPGRGFRNDVAFAMADHVISGHQALPERRMPMGITTVDYPVMDLQINEDWMVVRGTDRADILPRQDLHIMSKRWLQGKGIERLQGIIP